MAGPLLDGVDLAVGLEIGLGDGGQLGPILDYFLEGGPLPLLLHLGDGHVEIDVVLTVDLIELRVLPHAANQKCYIYASPTIRKSSIKTIISRPDVPSTSHPQIPSPNSARCGSQNFCWKDACSPKGSNGSSSGNAPFPRTARHF